MQLLRRFYPAPFIPKRRSIFSFGRCIFLISRMLLSNKHGVPHDWFNPGISTTPLMATSHLHVTRSATVRLSSVLFLSATSFRLEFYPLRPFPTFYKNVKESQPFPPDVVPPLPAFIPYCLLDMSSCSSSGNFGSVIIHSYQLFYLPPELIDIRT